MPSRPPEISVLLPARDAEPWIHDAVQDLRAQVGVELEIIAVDDGSTDRTATILGELAAADPRIQVLESGGRGPAHALNLALERSRGRWIGQMEADDRCPPDRFAQLLEELRCKPEQDAVVSQVELIGTERTGMQRYIDWQNELLEPPQLADARFIEIPAMHQTGLYRRSALEELDGYRDDPRWPLDIDFWMRWFEAGRRVSKLPRALYSWRQHPRQTTRVSPRHRKEALRICKVHYFLRGPGRDRPVEVYSVGETLQEWERDLSEAGCAEVRAVDWKPGRSPEPPVREGVVRLFVFGVDVVRRRARGSLSGFDRTRDWFAA